MKDKLLEESLKLDKIIKDKSGIDKDPAIIFAYANIDKIKFLASSELMYERQDVCINYIASIYVLSEFTEKELRYILNKNGIIAHNIFMILCAIIFIIMFFIGVILFDLTISFSHLLLYIVICVVPFILYMALAEYLSSETLIRTYIIPKEYRGMKLEKHSLKRGFR